MTIQQQIYARPELASARIQRFHHRFVSEMPHISIQRAKYYTEKWREVEKTDLTMDEKVALAMRNVYEKMDINLDPDDRIVGTWTEFFLGIPIDIERGLYNGVLEIELDSARMKRFALLGNLQFAWYKIRKDGLRNLLDNLRYGQKVGLAMPALGSTTLDKRKINPYQISKQDKRELLRTLLPKWKNKTIVEKLKKSFMDEGIYDGGFREFISHLPRGTANNDMIVSIGAALGVWQGHLILDHETAIKVGLIGLQNQVKEILRGNNDLPKEERGFLRALDIAFEGVMIYAKKIADKVKFALDQAIDTAEKTRLAELYAICQQVPFYPARTFKEAVQSYWAVKTAVELAIPFNVHSPGRQDQYFYPYYKADKEKGLITDQEVDEHCQELFLKVMAHNMRPYSNASSDFSQRYEGSEPVTLGGLTPEGKDATNDLTYIMVDAAAKSRASLNFAVRIHPNTPERLLMQIAQLHYQGVSSISVMNDTIGVQALKNRGVSQEDANNYAVTGCVDMCVPGKTGGEHFSSMMLCHTLDVALRNGRTLTLMGIVNDLGVKSGDPDTFKTFDEFVQAFLVQTDFMTKKIAEASIIRDKLYARDLPAPYISAFMQDCIGKHKDVTRAGAIYDFEGILYMTSIANTVDSLYVIKKLIFEQKCFTFKELLDAMDHNYEPPYDHIFKLIQDLEGKWGNGNPESDEIAHCITDHMFKETYKYRTYKNGRIAPFINSMTTHTYDGRISLATADGRKAGLPFAASCNPYDREGRTKKGPTGILRSVAALNYTDVFGCAVNIRMHPSGIGTTPESWKKWMALIKTYFQMGGEQLQPTVVSTATLRAAQQNPDQYRDVIVKVGGYSAYFVDLGKEVQEEIISRTEHQ